MSSWEHRYWEEVVRVDDKHGRARIHQLTPDMVWIFVRTVPPLTGAELVDLCHDYEERFRDVIVSHDS